jgi:3-hydroxyacyl-CoA dehydrogenase
MSCVARYEVDGEIGLITIDSPPVNALGSKVRRAIHDGFQELAGDGPVRAIILICEGRTFFAGADIAELGKPVTWPDLKDVMANIESSPKPVIAALHGTALGGGLELALACHYRVAVPAARVGLPEVKLGVLPGGGGTQRLPRVVGVEIALDLITSGRPIGAEEAFKIGIVDGLAEEGRLRDGAMAFARRILVENRPVRLVRDRNEKVEAARGKPEIFATFRKARAREFRGFKAPENIIKAIEASVELPFEAGLIRERELFAELVGNTQSAAQRYAFFAERETSKIPDVPADTPILPVKAVAVIGAGTMGGGITMNFLNAGLPVTLVEMNQAALDRGVSVIRKNFENTARKGRITQAQVEERMGLIKPSLAFEDIAAADLVIEAVFESMPLKKEVFRKLDTIAKRGAILASNTSFLDLNEIARATGRPEWVVGTHFFSPANVMRLLEIVRGEKTSKAVIATAMKLAKQIGKVPVLSRVCDGFIANRILKPRMIQAEALVLEGPTPAEIDQVICDYGFAMGPFQMIDLVGLDVLGRDQDERTLRGDLVALDRLGQKKNGGFYDYDDDRRATPSPAAAAVIAAFAKAKGVTPSGGHTPDSILARLLYPIVNEGAKLLEEGIALRASDVDMAAILGYSWPVFTGGPMFWADTMGLPKIVTEMREMETRYGEVFRPAPLLARLAAERKSFT